MKELKRGIRVKQVVARVLRNHISKIDSAATTTERIAQSSHIKRDGRGQLSFFFHIVIV